MTVYVVTNPENGWDCVCGVFSSEENLAEYFNERQLAYYDEDGDEIIKDFTGMSLMEIDEFLSDNDFNYITHEEVLI